jgi:ammonia channel protein AmtB
MGLDTLDNYRSEAESERLGLRGMIGRAMTFVGFIVLANAFLIALLFRHLLSFRNQIIFAVSGAVVGLIGMVVRGNTRSQLATATIASIAAVAVFVIVSFLEERFGLMALVGIVLVIAFLIQKFEERLWKRL